MLKPRFGFSEIQAGEIVIKSPYESYVKLFLITASTCHILVTEFLGVRLPRASALQACWSCYQVLPTNPPNSRFRLYFWMRAGKHTNLQMFIQGFDYNSTNYIVSNTLEDLKNILPEGVNTIFMFESQYFN